MIKILGRSATGQKITTYTSLVTGPRRQGESDGCEEMHVILLDNGRSRILGGPIAEILGCIRCGACLNACPVYKNIGGHAYGDTYPGPVGAIVTPGLRGIRGWKALPDASSLCGACRDVCPVRLDIPRMLLELRKQAVEEAGVPWTLRAGLWGFGMAASRPWLYRLCARLGGIGARLLAPGGWIKKLPGLAGGWTRSRDMKTPGAEKLPTIVPGAPCPLTARLAILCPRTPGPGPRASSRKPGRACRSAWPILSRTPARSGSACWRSSPCWACEAHVEASEADVRARVSALIAGKSVLSWDADKLPYGTGACLAATDRKVYYGSDSKADQGQAEIGLTGCENAIAETGTLAMTSGPGRPRSASLMPIVHVAVIRAADILLGMGEYFRKAYEATIPEATASKRAKSVGHIPYVVFITGPSRTADIELSLTLGVHGPGELIAVIGP